MLSVEFPCRRRARVEHNSSPQTQAARRTVMIVEDDPGILKMLTMVMREQGYGALPINKSEDALQLGREYPEPTDLVVTDVIMPMMSGKELARALRVARPTIQVLYMSGYPRQTIVCRGLIEPSDCFVQKPFLYQDLLTILERLRGGAGKAKGLVSFSRK